MFDYFIVLTIVGIAVYFTARELVAQVKGQVCDKCAGCAASLRLEEMIKQIDKRSQIDKTRDSGSANRSFR